MVHTSVRFPTFRILFSMDSLSIIKCSRSFSVSNEAHSVGDDKFISSKKGDEEENETRKERRTRNKNESMRKNYVWNDSNVAPLILINFM